MTHTPTTHDANPTQLLPWQAPRLVNLSTRSTAAGNPSLVETVSTTASGSMYFYGPTGGTGGGSGNPT